MDKGVVKIIIRDVQKEDGPFIFSTWLKGVYFGNEFFRNVRERLFMSKYQQVLEQLLPSSTVKVACLEDDTDIVIGYAVYSGTRLHYVYVKSGWRLLGVARSLIPSDIKSVSHMTDVGAKLRNKYSLEFDPFL